MKTTNPPVGGQAIVEGVMFQNATHAVSAIRRNDDSIETFAQQKPIRPRIAKGKRIPLLRGLFALMESSANGASHMNFASDRYGVKPGEEEPEETTASPLTKWLGVAVVGILSFFFGKLLFTLLPAFLASLFDVFPALSGHVIQNVIEAAIKLTLLFSYLYVISLTPLVKRLFQYHGAEHKVINCVESGRPLTVENVRISSRLHYRCGSSFLIFTVIVGFFVYLIVPTDPLWLRLVCRIALLPVVIGLSFEVLQLTNKAQHIRGLRVIALPGLWLQYLTTKEPDDSQIEVAIYAFEALEKQEHNLHENALG
ncbi:DUF1385 domain-containing protein [Exiguobacterium acetylicum]|uniref:DUF1385 domain-containing protein n=1 Tax=Exiguobacterium acetylicum TaxID=41170 RepID=UPI001EE30BD4|nr:DUF1385 domain-containing protein [Exiguobacterium acetylicum]UKS56951.1 DUF1385 domain-containing protein [Exiguobacterium acetylicum]